MDKREIAHVFRTMGALLEIKGEDSFKVRSYERAAESLQHCDFDLAAMANEGRLTEIPGIGKNLEPKLRELALTGRSSFLERLVQEVPEGLLDLLRVPGVGPKTARLLHDALGVAGLSDLKKALAEHRVQRLPGLGRKREELMQKGLGEIEKYAGRLSLGIALPVLENLTATLSNLGIEAEIVGETRRYEETVAFLDALVLETEGEKPQETVLRSGILPAPDATALEQAWDAALGGFTFRTSFGVPLRLFFSPRREFRAQATALTGPDAFLHVLAKKAEERGYRFTRGCLFKGDRPLDIGSDEALFEALGAGYVPPELRHRSEFVEAAFALAPGSEDPRIRELVSPNDIRGDLHVHTTWSDGTAGIEEMVQAARRLRYRYIAVTDHATEIKLIRGLTPERLPAQLAEIEGLRSKYPDIRILSGVEVDILKDGRLYLEDDVLAKLDVVVASVHQDIGNAHGEMQNRLVRAASNPNVDVIGHATGRLIGRRPGTQAGLVAVFQAASTHGTALEINSSPERLDLPEGLAALAMDAGARFAICTDAHSPESLLSIRYGVFASARRAGIPRDRVINTSPDGGTFINS